MLSQNQKNLEKAINFFGSQKALAEASGYSRESVNRYKLGKRKIPIKFLWTIEVLLKNRSCKVYAKADREMVRSATANAAVSLPSKAMRTKLMEFIEVLVEEQDSVPPEGYSAFCFCVQYVGDNCETEEDMDNLIALLKEEKNGYL